MGYLPYQLVSRIASHQQFFMTPETAKTPQTAKVKSFPEMPKNGAMSRGAVPSMMAGMDDKNLTDPNGLKGGIGA